METNNILQEIGLSQTESKVYLALLELGNGLAGAITKESGINRTNVYDALERLLDKGLVTYVITANRKVFEPVSPKKLQEILKEKENKLNLLIPELNSRFKENKQKEKATLYKGSKGIKSIFESVLEEGKTLFAYGAESKFTELLPAYKNYWNKERIKNNIKVEILYNEKVKRLKKQESLKLMTMKFLPKKYDFPSTIMIYGDNVATIVWSESPFGFVVKSKEVTKSNMNFFKILWKTAKY
jgi:sugar-specific transcriptional regulator TrmB